MKNVKVRFEEDPTLGHIDVCVRAAKKDDDVSALIERIKKGSLDTLAVTEEDGTVRVIKTLDVIYFSVDGKRMQVVTAERVYYLNRSLQSLSEELDPIMFIRTSRYELINLTKVVRYDFTLAGTLRIELEGGMETWASRRCIPLIRKRLSGKE